MRSVQNGRVIRRCRAVSAWLLPLLLLLSRPLLGDAWDDLRARGVLRWANDAEGGVPFIYHAPDDPSKLTGFEVEFAEALCGRLGLRSEFVQYNWVNLIPGLRQGGNFDVIVAALERSPANLSQVAMSRPYFFFGQQLVVRAEDTRFRALADLHGRPVGVLGACEAHRILVAEKAIDVKVYDENVNYFRDLELGRIDAILTDSTIAEAHLPSHPKLRRAGPAFAPGAYAVAVPPGEDALLARIDDAILGLARDGTLERIYRRYGLWSDEQVALGTWTPDADPEPKGDTRAVPAGALGRIGTYLPVLLRAAVTTLWVTVASMLLAILWGLPLAVGRVYGPAPVRWLCVAYVEVFRGTPLLLQLYFVYFGLAQQLGWKLSAGVAAVLTLGLNYAANEAENYRAGLQAIPRGQTEAALALGMGPWLTLRRILLPQALRISLPGVTNDFIALFKDSSIVSVIGLVELTKEFLIRALDAGDYLGLGVATAAIYFAMGWAASLLARAVERRLHR